MAGFATLPVPALTEPCRALESVHIITELLFYHGNIDAYAHVNQRNLCSGLLALLMHIIRNRQLLTRGLRVRILLLLHIPRRLS